jgi:hypothetical protein
MTSRGGDVVLSSRDLQRLTLAALAQAVNLHADG